MKITHEPLNEKVLSIHVTLTPEDYLQDVGERLKSIRKTASMPGFRAGKVPASIIEKKFGREVRYEIIGRAAARAVSRQLQDEGIKTIGGLINTRDENRYDQEQQEYQVELTAGLLSVPEKPFDSGVTLPYYTIQADQEEIDNMIAAGQKQHGERVDAEDIQDEDILTVSAHETDGTGAIAEGGIKNEQTYLMVKYIADEETKAEILKAKKGDRIVMDLKKALGADAEIASFLGIERDKAGELANPFQVTINEVKRIAPHPIDPELCKRMLGPDTDATDEEGLRRALQQKQAESYARTASRLFASEVSIYLLGLLQDKPVSTEHIATMLTSGETDDYEAVLKQAERMAPYARYQMVMKDLLEQYGLQVTDQDIRAELRDITARQLSSMGLDYLLNDANLVDKFVERHLSEQSEALSEAQFNALERALARKARETVTIEEKTIAPSELQELSAQQNRKIEELLFGRTADAPEEPGEAAGEEA